MNPPLQQLSGNGEGQSLLSGFAQADIIACLEELLARPLQDMHALLRWMHDISRVESAIHEEISWRRIRLTKNPAAREAAAAYRYFTKELDPLLRKYAFALLDRLVRSPYKDSLPSDLYPFLRYAERAAGLYTVKNEQIRLEIAGLLARFRSGCGADAEDLFDRLLSLRTQEAKNAGFENYLEFRFRELGRFDYTPADCTEFHEAVRHYVVPLKRRLAGTGAEPPPAIPESDLLAYWPHALHPELARCLDHIRAAGRYDIEARPGKMSGAYTALMAVSGVPFVFINPTGSWRDRYTLLHESGHALHAWLTRELPFHALKIIPLEMSELAAVTMELFGMQELCGASALPVHMLQRMVRVLTRSAAMDAFQHWLYASPGHTRAERDREWECISAAFALDEDELASQAGNPRADWRHHASLYESPLYYIEYGLAQLGALAMWKQFAADRGAAMTRFTDALRLGNTRTLPGLYEAAGIPFDMSPEYVKAQAGFLEMQLPVSARSGMQLPDNE